MPNGARSPWSSTTSLRASVAVQILLDQGFIVLEVADAEEGLGHAPVRA
jgi:hypothetical protein